MRHWLPELAALPTTALQVKTEGTLKQKPARLAMDGFHCRAYRMLGKGLSEEAWPVDLRLGRVSQRSMSFPQEEVLVYSFRLNTGGLAIEA